MIETRRSLEIALKDFTSRPLRDAAVSFLNTLGYESQRILPFDSLEMLIEAVPNLDSDLRKLELYPDITRLIGLFQLTADEVRTSGQNQMFSGGKYQNTNINSYLFFALELTRPEYTRTQLADLTRFINKHLGIPVFLLLNYGGKISLSVTRRRINKRDVQKDVVEKITIIKDIRLDAPNSAHLHILEELFLPDLMREKLITRFTELEEAWNKVLDIEVLNKRFYQELANWFYWATSSTDIYFPNEKNKTREEFLEIRQTHLIRLITRLIFVWFLKEKDLVPNKLFEPKKLEEILNNFATDSGNNYYQNILQNLFFATLNTEMGEEDEKPNRRFKSDLPARGNTGYMVHNLYRYQSGFKDPRATLEAFGSVPFLNGGLFECLDREADKETGEKEIRIDGFSDTEAKRAKIPNQFFFSSTLTVDLSEYFGKKAKKTKVAGLIEILSAYKFTITENTPIEEEVALDPELLGKVFENLLAAYNPETKETARKQTGSFYTPRDIVDFMVDESLIAYLHRALTGGLPVVSGVRVGEQAATLMPENDPNLLIAPNAGSTQPDPLEQKLKYLFSYETRDYNSQAFTENQIKQLIHAIENVKILDLACGSGAFPIGVLQKLVFVLKRLDPNNKRWLEARRAKLEQEIIEDPEIKTIKKDLQTIKNINVQSIRNIAEREAVGKIQERIINLEESFNTEIADSNYARKLYLIEDCIYGVDIQPIAIQIAKLRCFIALVVEQRTSDKPNRGIRPLPNLETKFVAANSLFDLSQDRSMAEFDPDVMRLKSELENIRHQHFRARNYRQKKALRLKDKTIRKDLKSILLKYGWSDQDASGMAAFDPYDQNSKSDFFSPEWMFGFKQFNVVLGNPPYVRHQKIDDQKPKLKASFGTLFSGMADLYIYFFKRGLDLLENGGILSYICSNKYFRSGYGLNLRTYLLKNTSLRQVIDFGDAEVFTAIAYPSIIVIKNEKPNNTTTIQALTWNQAENVAQFREIHSSQAFAMPQSSLSNEAWRIERNDVLELLETIKNAGISLHEYVHGRFYLGIMTGLNESFIIDRSVRDLLIKQHKSSEKVLKPILRGRDVKRWKVKYSEQYLIKLESSENVKHPWSELPDIEAEEVFKKTYPAIYEHLFLFKDALGLRQNKGRYYWEMRSCHYWKEFEQLKIILPTIEQRASFALDVENYFGNDKTSICISEKPEFLLGLLNSSVLWWCIRQIAAARQGGFFEFKPTAVTSLPIPHASTKVSDLITLLVKHILFATKYSILAVVVAYLEQMIDALVYELFLPEVLHTSGRYPFQVLSADAPPAESSVEGLEAYYRRVYDPNQEIRKLIYRLPDIAEIAIIEGKK